MKNRRILAPTIVGIIVGLLMISGVILFTASQANNLVTNGGRIVGSLPKGNTTLPVVQQVIGADLKITGNLSTQSIVANGSISADSITSKNNIKASNMTFTKTNNADSANQLYVTADGSLNYYNGVNSTNLSVQNSQLVNGGVTSIAGSTGNINLGAGLGIAGQSLQNNGVLSVGNLTGNIGLGGGLIVSGNNLNLSLPQDIATTSSPTFNALTLSTALPVAGGGTGSNTAPGARTKLGAAASGTNNDITSLTALTSIAPTSSLTVGATNQSLTLQGSSVSISEYSGSFISTLDLVAPTANVTYQLQTAAAGTYDVCTTVGNCVGIGGGVTTLGGTIGKLSKFTSGSAIGDSIITDNGSTVSIAGTLSVNNITPTTAAIIGATTQSLTLQGAATTLTSTNGSYTNTLSFTTPSGSNKSIVIPNASGTIAVSATGPMVINALGDLSCPTCLTTGVNGGTTGVSSVNSQTGAITIASVTGSSIITGGGTITIQDASSTVKGLASFNSTNLTVTSGNVNTVQGISTAASPTFTGLTLTNALSVASGGTGLGSTPLAGQLLIGNGAGYTLSTLTAGSGITIDNTTPGQITVTAPTGGTCPTCATRALDNLNTVAINTSLLPGITNAIDLGSATLAYRNGYVAGIFQAGSFDAITAATLSIGSTNATSVNLAANTTIAANKSLTANGSALFKNNTNSTTAFQIQNAASTTILNADTINGAVAIGTATSLIGQYSNAAKVDYTTGTNPYSVTAADFNGDGKPDMAVTNTSDNTVSIFINNGNGTFATKVGYTVGSNPYSVTSADFNGDGKPDLAVANLNSNTVSVLINNGTGTFAAKVDYTTGSSPRSVIAADFNGDGKPDMAVANATSATVSVLINNGAGTFATKVDYTTGTTPYSVTAADLNGDGKPDLAVANQGSNTVSVLINNGAGTFATKVDYTTGTTPSSVTAADLNGDGKPDLTVTNQASATVSVFINNGTGTFATKVDYTTGSNPYSVASADLNGDGKPDLAVANYSSATVSVFINNGTGTFATKVDYITAASPSSVTAADFNGDGKPDLAVANFNSNTVSVFINNTLGWSPKLTVLTSTSSVAQVIQGASGQTADLLQAKDGSGNIMFSVGATGSVLAKNDINSNTAFQIQNATGTSIFDVDSINNAVLIGSAKSITRQFSIAAKVDYTTGTTPYSVTAADFNGDGKPDIAVANLNSNTVSVFINNGTGTFATKVDYITGTNPYSVTSADFNGDDKPDLAVANQGSATVSVFINNGTGTFAAKVDYTTGTNPYSVTAADFNGDDKPDLAVANANSNTVSVFINNGNGTFATKVDYATGTNPYSVTSADFNGDSKPDLAVANLNSNTVSVFINNGNGTFAAKVDYTTGSNPSSVTAADLNGDGKSDLAVTIASSATVSIFINNGNGTYATKVDYTTGSTPRSVTAADLNGDDKPDLAVANYNSNTVSVFINTTTAPNQLAINNLTTVGSTTAQVAVATSSISNKGLIIQGMNGQTADLFQTQNSSGAVLARISATGALSVVSATINGTLTVNGHIITGGASPIIVAGTAACTTPTVSISGNDSAGTITINTGTGCSTAGTMATVTFNGAFGTAPRVVLTPVGAATASLIGYSDTISTTSFVIGTTVTPTNSTTYKFNYLTVQ